MNPIYQQMNQNSLNGFMAQVNKLKQSFNGNPNQKIQEMLNTGKVTQAQYNQAVNMANRIQQMLGK